MRLAIIGMGAMGRRIAEWASAAGHEVRGFGRGQEHEASRWAEAIIVAVPHWEAGNVISRIGEAGYSGLLTDIATYKRFVVDAYKKLSDNILAATSHPMFGPGADKPGKVIVMDVGRQGLNEVAELWRGLGARVVIGDVEEHDRYVAYTVGLSYAIALAYARLLNKLGDKAILYGGTSMKYLALFAEQVLADKHAYRYVEPALSAVEEFVDELRKTDTPNPITDPSKCYLEFYEALRHISCIGDSWP